MLKNYLYMKILAINGGTSGSSWNICCSVLRFAQMNGHDVFVATPSEKPDNFKGNYYQIGNKISRYLHRLITKLNGSDGFCNNGETRKLIKHISSIKPDIVHLHTLHGYFINIQILINYLKKMNVHLVITCHDCWWFTGRCAHFFSNKCDAWKNRKCKKCNYKNAYPKSLLFDRAAIFLEKKAKIFKDYQNLHIICVSDWLSNLCAQSYVFKGKNIQTIYNGIDINIFSLPHSNLTSARNKVISVAAQWNNSKGIDIIIELARKYDYLNFTIVGNLSNKIVLPANILNIPNVSNKEKLATLYQENHVFLNPSKQETFSLVNIEAQLCGLPVICFNETGMKETISPQSFALTNYSFEEFDKKLMSSLKKEFNKNEIREFAIKFSLQEMNGRYLKVYEE